MIYPSKSYESEHEDESFVNILEDSKSSPSGGPISAAPEDQEVFVGYYDSGNVSVHSVKSGNNTAMSSI